ncbi:bifunctional hydroxymethylpyrimidine kinase/phosphomethylpyrimidine kinase [Sporobacter termitidis]|nr:bifunctional hydroxymethylpyrimidine kinase/phosphomethylpyrimidine kinase [Sporobacter termitidis]
MLKKVLTIAGSDCSGGAGIQADIKTITAHKMYAMSAITALTAQNTTGVYGIFEATPEFVASQLDCIFSDIRPDAVKIGMVSSPGIIAAIAERLAFYNAENIVIDPVMAATSGGRLLLDGAAQTLMEKLFPLGTVVTPNIPEAEALSGIEIMSGRNVFSQRNMIRAAEIIASMTKGAVLVKGGHLECSADDLLYAGGTARWFSDQRVDNPNTHGTGCTLSSAIACNLAAGYSLADSVRRAKDYVTGALKAGLRLGNGRGPLDHTWRMGPD